MQLLGGWGKWILLHPATCPARRAATQLHLQVDVLVGQPAQGGSACTEELLRGLQRPRTPPYQLNRACCDGHTNKGHGLAMIGSCWVWSSGLQLVSPGGSPGEAACLGFMLTRVTAHFVTSVISDGGLCVLGPFSVSLSSIVVRPVAALAWLHRPPRRPQETLQLLTVASEGQCRNLRHSSEASRH